MKDYSKKRVGRRGERVAARYLRRRGYRIVAKNERHGKNELDLVVKDGQYIVFVEVKARSFLGEMPSDSRPAEAVDRDKRLRTAKAALDHLHDHPSPLCPRFDVVEVWLDRAKHLKVLRINHIVDAFSANGRARH